MIIQHLADVKTQPKALPLPKGLLSAKMILQQHKKPPSSHACHRVCRGHAVSVPPAVAITMLGDGCAAEQALDMAIYCALVAEDISLTSRWQWGHSGYTAL